MRDHHVVTGHDHTFGRYAMQVVVVKIAHRYAVATTGASLMVHIYDSAV